MALFAIAGIPWLAGILGTIFGGLISFFAQFFTKKLAIAIAGVTALLFLAGAFIGLMYGLTSSISYVTPPEISQFFYYVMPSNTVPCLSAVMTAHVAKYVYSWNVRIIQMKLGL